MNQDEAERAAQDYADTLAQEHADRQYQEYHDLRRAFLLFVGVFVLALVGVTAAVMFLVLNG